MFDCVTTVKPVLSSHSKIDKTKILMTNGSWMKVESIAECSPCILQYFWPALSHNRSRITNFGLLFEWPLKTGFTVYETGRYYLGALILSTSLTQASSILGSITVWAIVTPTLAQNRLIASGGKPLRLRAVSVNRRGSSQSLENKEQSITLPDLTTWMKFLKAGILYCWGVASIWDNK